MPKSRGKVLFSNLGFTPSAALAPILAGYKYSHVVLFHGPPTSPEGQKAASECTTVLNTHKIPHTIVPVRDAFDYTSFLIEYSQKFDELSEYDVEFCAAGGTRVMTMAGAIFCFSTGTKLLYFDDVSAKEGKYIPLHAMRHLEKLGENPRKVLRFLQSGPKDMGDISEFLQLAPSTVTVHVRRLVQAQAVTIEKAGKHRIVHLAEDLRHVPIL